MGTKMAEEPENYHTSAKWKLEALKRDFKKRKLEEAREEIRRMKEEIPSPPSAKEKSKREMIEEKKGSGARLEVEREKPLKSRKKPGPTSSQDSDSEDSASACPKTTSTVRQPVAIASQSASLNVAPSTIKGFLFKKELGFKPYDGPPMSEDSDSDNESRNDKKPPAEPTSFGKKYSPNDIDSSEESDPEKPSPKAMRKVVLNNDMIDSSPSPDRVLRRDSKDPLRTVETKVSSPTTTKENFQQVNSKRPRNPFQVQRLEDERDKELRRQNAFRGAPVNEDALWDTDGEEGTATVSITRRQAPRPTSPASKAPRNPPRRAVRSKRREDLGNPEDEEEVDIDSRNSRENAASVRSPCMKSVHSDDSDDPENDDEVDNVQQDFKPSLANPHFGPYPFKPLELINRETGTSQHEVPAALARYLPPFQREGVQFLYDAVCEDRGTILGELPAVLSLLWLLFG
jgi:hypothetical protein